ncbi:hypothetical protein protein [Bacillus cereus G9241]|nr:hypothetical protein protein [Bacillus cereus G9241]
MHQYDALTFISFVNTVAIAVTALYPFHALDAPIERTHNQ